MTTMRNPSLPAATFPPIPVVAVTADRGMEGSIR